MMTLDQQMAFANTTPAHPVTITEQPGADREYTWVCPPDCVADPCLMLDRLRRTDWIKLADHLPADEYLAAPTLTTVYLTQLDGSDVPAMPIKPLQLSEAQLDELAEAGNKAIADQNHADLCACDGWPANCLNFKAGMWDTGVWQDGLPTVLALWEQMRPA